MNSSCIDDIIVGTGTLHHAAMCIQSRPSHRIILFGWYRAAGLPVSRTSLSDAENPSSPRA